MQQAVTRFAHQQADTLDVAAFTGFAWDSMYVFGGYSRCPEVQDGWPRVDWSRVWEDGGIVPDSVQRLVFVHRNTAVGYLEVPSRLVGAVHYRRYFADERGYFHSYYSLPSGGFAEPSNGIARANARFVLVCPAQVPEADSTRYVFAAASFFRGRETLLRQAMRHAALNLHPLQGCGYFNCGANNH